VKEDAMTTCGTVGRAAPAFLWAALSAVVASAGCSAVLTVEPVGREPVVLDPAQWDGLWCDVGAVPAYGSGTDDATGHCATITVVDPREGTLKLVDATSGDPDQAAIVRQDPTSSAIFATMPWPPEDDNSFWVQIRMEEDVLIYWEPAVHAFRALVEAGALPGSVVGGDVVLAHLDGSAMGVLREHDATLFKWKDPQVLVRVRR
jgi:hypothetical protein